MKDFLVPSIYPHLDRDAARWAAWASEHGWTYKGPEAPELVGRFFPPPGGRDGEWYYHLLTTVLQGLDVTAFERRTRKFRSFWSHNVDNTDSVSSHVAVRLPGLPPPELVAMGSRRALEQLGAGIGGYDLEVRGSDLIASGRDPLDSRPRRGLQGVAEGLTAQVASMPASFWRPRPPEAPFRPR